MMGMIKGKCFLLIFIPMFISYDTSTAIATLIVPSTPVTTTTGQNAILPCYLSPEKSAAPMQIRWFRDQYGEYIYLYTPGDEREGRGYEGRVSLFPQELARGNVSLLLRDVRLTDAGEYRCHVSQDDWFEEPSLQLIVRQQGSVPLIEFLNHNRDNIQMRCTSEDWYPEPNMFWTNSKGRKMEAQTEKPKQKTVGGVYSITSHISINQSSLDSMGCIVGEQNQKIQLESLVKINDEFFMSTVPDRVYISAAVIPITVGLISVVAAVLLINHQKKVRQDKLKSFDSVTKELETLQKEMWTLNEVYDAVKQMPKSVWSCIINHTVNVILDPDTAHPKLSVAEDGKSVTAVSKSLHVPDNRRRFEEHFCVLAKEGFSSGKHYWEVEVGEKTVWYVGVGKEIKDPAEVFKPEKGYWILYYSENDVFCAVTAPDTPIPISLKPQTLGVYVDCNIGQVSFYNVDDRCHIYTFTDVFNVKLYPFFGTRLTCMKPLRICSTNEIQEQEAHNYIYCR